MYVYRCTHTHNRQSPMTSNDLHIQSVDPPKKDQSLGFEVFDYIIGLYEVCMYEKIHLYPCVTIFFLIYTLLNQRKFRSETSDNMDTWKSRGGKSQKGEDMK